MHPVTRLGVMQLPNLAQGDSLLALEQGKLGAVKVGEGCLISDGALQLYRRVTGELVKGGKLAARPRAGTLALHRNGLRMIAPGDYTLEGRRITWTGQTGVNDSDVIVADYEVDNSPEGSP
jgi:hypothetical protein